MIEVSNWSNQNINVMNRLGMSEIIIILAILGIILLVLIFLAWYFVSRAKAKDRQFLIEKGIDLNQPGLKSQSQFSWLKTGIVLTGISLSLFLLAILDKYASIGSIFGFAIILAFAGISMIIAHYTGITYRA